MISSKGLRILTIVLAATVLLSIASSVVRTALADVPDVLQIEDIFQGSAGKIRVQVRHLNPSTSHYVDSIEVDINGQVTKFDLQPQNTNPFTVQLDIGQFQGKPNVRARARCNLHGWSAWSAVIQIPEFLEIGLVAFLALSASLLLVRKRRKIR